jgi:hypothetical protein
MVFDLIVEVVTVIANISRWTTNDDMTELSFPDGTVVRP